MLKENHVTENYKNVIVTTRTLQETTRESKQVEENDIN